MRSAGLAIHDGKAAAGVTLVSGEKENLWQASKAFIR